MSDRTETHSDFAWPAAELPWARDPRDTESLPSRGSTHSFVAYAGGRYPGSCVRCGKAEHNVVHKARP